MQTRSLQSGTRLNQGCRQETIDEIQQLLFDLGEFLTVEVVDQEGTRDRESTEALNAERPVTDKGPPCDGLRTN